MKLTAVFIISIIAAVIFLLWRVDYLSAKWDNAKLLINTRDNTINELNKSIEKLASLKRDNDKAQVIHQQQLTKTTERLNIKNKQLQRLTHENEMLRDWFNSGLPPDVIRLRQRPAINGASDYRKWLSERDSLPVSGPESIH
ncbi:Rz-like lysis system protein LysB [Limnobaculum xujianqingii]|uniref:Rz-like lysis system protein LysB n=1 Tax=Limnobaculum xujianqingii TaxID=2738837 RepID=UPI0015B89A49|nr:Rz-like lysis system protein LysB [Limnobaculum xujianqingii]